MRVHPFPFRTRKLSSSVPKILGWKRPGKIGRRQHFLFLGAKCCAAEKSIFYSSIAQSVERMTVNHDVTGSSPVGGARKNSCSKEQEFFQLYSPSASYIELRSVIFASLSYICFASVIRFASYGGEYNITENVGFNITFTK